MACCSEITPQPEETVSKCPNCQCDVDIDGISTEGGCSYSPEICNLCHDCPCDWSC